MGALRVDRGSKLALFLAGVMAGRRFGWIETVVLRELARRGARVVCGVWGVSDLGWLV